MDPNLDPNLASGIGYGFQAPYFQLRLIGSVLVPASATEKEHTAYQIEVYIYKS